MSYKELDKLILGEVWSSSEALRNLENLCDTFGPRFAGTRSEAAARKFLLQKLSEAGVSDVHEEPVEFLAWERRRSPKLRVLSPLKASIMSLALPYSPAGEVEAEVIDLGMGLPDDFEREHARIRGKIVLVSNQSPPWLRRWVHRAERYGRSVRAGAVGFVFANFLPGALPETGCVRFGRKGEIPGVSISREDHQYLLRLLRKPPLRLQLQTFDRTRRAVSANVVGQIRGTERPDEYILVGAHFDGHDISPGSDDNGSGTVALIETARILSMHREALKRSVMFALFTAEEIGLIGARSFVGRHRALLERIRLVINVDGIGNERGKGFDFHGWHEGKQLVAALAKDMEWELDFACRIGMYSDHFPFILEGVPAASFGNFSKPASGRGFGHTVADTLDKVSLFDLREAVSTLARSIVRFANMAPWPLRHRSPAEVKEMLRKEQLLDIMKAEK